MTKRTAKQRIERAVEKEYLEWLDQEGAGWLSIAIACTIAERQRLRRQVRKLARYGDTEMCRTSDYTNGYKSALADVLARLEG